MLIKLEKIISCTSEHPLYPSSNLLRQRSNASWRCAKPGELMATVIIQLAEPSCITGLDIGNYRCCIVVVEASTSAEPDKWIPIVNHRFMTHDEAANGRFKDQVGLFAKKELNSETLKIKFDRVKVSCVQSANLRELFGLAFFVPRTEVVPELSCDVVARFKLKTEKSMTENLTETRPKLFTDEWLTRKENPTERTNEAGARSFVKRRKDDEARTERPFLEKIKANDEASREINDEYYAVERKQDEISSSNARASNPVRRTPFGDAITGNANKIKARNNDDEGGASVLLKKKRSLRDDDSCGDRESAREEEKGNCCVCASQCQDRICKNCKELQIPQNPGTRSPQAKNVKKAKMEKKAKKQFSKLFEDVSFSLSGYVNPRRDEIRRKALKMGGKYIVDPDTNDNRCTHLVCAFKNTPKSRQLKGHTKMVSHKFIDECYDKKMRLPWRRFALDRGEKSKSESEDEIEGGTSPVCSPNPYERDTDSDSNH